MDEKIEKAKNDLDEINKRLAVLEKKGIKAEFVVESLKSIEKILNIVSEMHEKGEKYFFESASIEIAPKTIVDYDLSIQLGLGSVPARLKALENPLLQLSEEGNKLIVVACFSGIDEKDIFVKLENGFLIVSIPLNKFEHRISIPLNMKLVGESFKNGVLELVLEKQF